jgi:cytochrome P450
MDVNLIGPEFIANPYPILAGLRAAGPVHATPFGFSIVLPHEHVNRIYRDPKLGRDLRKWVGWDKVRPYLAGSVLEHVTENFMLNMDPPRHTRLRRLVSAAFTPRTVAKLEEPIGAIADQLLDAMTDRADDGAADFMTGFARPFPVRVIMALLGLPETDLAVLARWSDAAALTAEPIVAQRDERAAAAAEACTELMQYLTDVVSWRRAHPDLANDDLIGTLLQVDATGDVMTDDELLGMVVGVFVAGHETTTNLLGNGLLALSENPDQWALLRDDPAGISRSAVEELLRYDPAVQTNARVSLEELDIGGTVVPAGTMMFGMTGAANRDPAVFTDPDTLDLRRSPNPHVTFGGGAHFCIGAGLARLEARIALERLAVRCPELEVDPAGVARRALINLRGLETLPLRMPVPIGSDTL